MIILLVLCMEMGSFLHSGCINPGGFGSPRSPKLGFSTELGFFPPSADTESGGSGYFCAVGATPALCAWPRRGKSPFRGVCPKLGWEKEKGEGAAFLHLQ